MATLYLKSMLTRGKYANLQEIDILHMRQNLLNLIVFEEDKIIALNLVSLFCSLLTEEFPNKW